MDVLRKLTLRTLSKNKKRTAVTIVGIILATALITAVANMAESFRASMIAYERHASGDFHYSFFNVEQENCKYFENNRNIKKLGYGTALGYAPLPDSQNPEKPYLFIKAMDEGGLQAAAIRLISGRLPKNDREILIAKHAGSDGGASFSIGDVIDLPIGERLDENGNMLGQQDFYLYEGEQFLKTEDRQYTIVGIMGRPDYITEGVSAPGYTAITFLEDAGSADRLDVYATYTEAALRRKDEVTAGILGVSEDLYNRYMKGGSYTKEEAAELDKVCDSWWCNIWLIKWQLFQFSGSTMSMLYSMSAVAIGIIIVASIFCIRNSFVISLTEKMKLYGMLAGVGATKKQRKQMVYTEAWLLGLIGIPIGVAGGCLATAVVIMATTGLFEESMGIPLVFEVSVPAMILGALLSAVTVFFSAAKSAVKAGRISPIRAIRGNETIKIREKEVRTPRLIRLFGIGGVIAYKNLRRARVKYRTTVVSIVVSVAVFIAMSAFFKMGFLASAAYYADPGYQLKVYLYDKNQQEEALAIANMPGVTYVENYRSTDMYVKKELIPFKKTYLTDSKESFDGVEDLWMSIVAVGEDAYRQYCEKIGISCEEAENKGILLANYRAEITDEKGKSKWVTGEKYDYHTGDVITGTSFDHRRSDGRADFSIEIMMQTDKYPVSISHKYSGDGTIIVSDKWFNDYVEQQYNSGTQTLFLRCEDADALETAIYDKFVLSDMEIINENREYQKVQSMYLVVAVFLYGFITVIALIGITNIFNTITTNMELRAGEFAMLKSVGMTNREFRRMIQLESFFYAGKALLIGIPIGIFLSYLFHKGLVEGMEASFRVPYEGILISVIAVAFLVFAIMRYSFGKLNRKNVIDTIRNENI